MRHRQQPGQFWTFNLHKNNQQMHKIIAQQRHRILLLEEELKTLKNKG